MFTAFDAFVIVIYVLATARVTRVVTSDKVSEPFRTWLLGKLGSDSLVNYYFWCRWCFGFWAAFTLAPAAIVLTGVSWWCLPFLALAASHVTGLLVKWEPSE